MKSDDIDNLNDLSAVKTSLEVASYPHIIDLFKKYNGIINAKIFKDNQVNYYQLNKLEEAGLITKLKRGLYALNDPHYIVDETVEVSLLVPKGVICLYSALAHYELTTFIPSEYTVAVSRKDRKPRLPDYPPIRVFFYDDDTFHIGMEKIDKNGYDIKIYDLERTICDIVKYRNKLDANVVKECLNNYSASKKKNYTKLLNYADKLRVRSILNNYLEVL